MSKEHNPKIFHALSFARSLGFLIIVPIVFFLFAGVAADRDLGTHHLLLVFGVATGVVFGVVSTYFLLRPFLKDKEIERT